jgi:DNA-binding transcriptional LysR family regulator
MDPFFSRLVLAPRLGDFLMQYPDLSLELVTTEAPGDLVAHGFDVGVRFGEPAAVGLIAHKLLETRILTVASPAYLERHGRPKHPVELATHKCIQYRDPQSGRPFAWEFRRGPEVVPVAVSGALTVTDVGTMLGACRAGVGVAQVMALGCEELLSHGDLVELFPGWPDETFPLQAYHPSRHHLPPKVRALIDFCCELSTRTR